MDEPGFLIDGKEYPIPNVWGFDTDEEQLLWDYAGLSLADFVRVDPDMEDAEALEADRRRRLLHPGLTRTYLHVAYRRGNRDVKDSEIKKLVGTVNRLEAMANVLASIHDEPEEDADPPAQSVTTNDPDGSSPSEPSVTDSSKKQPPESSSTVSRNGSDGSDRTLVSTGTG